MKSKILLLSLLATLATAPGAAAATITVQVDKPGAKVSPLLWGIFFEDINCSVDGGVYAELVRNRSFEDSERLNYWTKISSGPAQVELKADWSLPVSAKNTNSLKVIVTDAGRGRVGVANNGFWGMAVEKGKVYNLSFHARADRNFTGPLTITLESTDGLVYAKQQVARLTPEWKEHSFSLTASDSDPNARLVISTDKTGTFWLDMVSLFPKETWKGRENGLRPDLLGMIGGLKPAFVRFPGGCWVEGETMDAAYRWKQTIGDISERRTQYNIWRYYATHGLGFHEYLQMTEDLGAEPLFVINCGMSHRENVPMDQMQEYVQDALDAIEYCNGPVDSKWGAIRAKNGHPAPFNLKYLEIGNENGGRAYYQRYALFHDAIKAKYPDIILIANVWNGVPSNRPIAIKDEHYYNTPDWFIRNANLYDNYDRNGAKIYVGEYAATQGVGLGNLRAAVGEAAFMTGMERNSDIVVMSSYAPLLVNVNHRGWNPDLIDYDSSSAYGTPSYHVQKMFAEHQGDVILPAQVDGSPILPSEPIRGMVGVGTWRTSAEYKDMVVTQGGKTIYSWGPTNGTRGWRFAGGDWAVEGDVLRQNNETAENVRAVTGDEKWTDYTFSVKGRKLNGNEGFLVMFGVKGNERPWWNIGGWGNTEEGLELAGEGAKRSPLRIERNRWYDIRIEVKGSAVKCFMDGQLVREADIGTPRPSLYTSAVRKNSTGEVILKVVNAAAEQVQTDIKLAGTGGLNGPVTAVVLTSEKPTDENSIQEPNKIVPAVKTIRATGTTINHVFPGNSVTIIRAKVR